MTREEAKRILYVYRAVNLVDASHIEAFDSDDHKEIGAIRGAFATLETKMHLAIGHTLQIYKKNGWI